ncbi:sulfotransferase family protein [Halomonas faecis]|uniref:sulfotransferase family protein n=1 Tax=Halomonas faecis TaxID=1562110 RepID=UPI0013D895E4|nr:sulfotransferase [Halomonas faecis]
MKAMDEKKGSPVFLLASERSGTNLLRRRLTEQQRTLFGPSPLHLLKHLYYAEPYYGDLRDDKNFIRFVNDALGLAYHHFSPWDVKIVSDEVLEYYPSLMHARSAVGVMHVLYTLYAYSKGYSSYFCKDNNLFDFVSEIRMELPQARFIYLYRDPRDVILSQKKRPLQNKSTVYLSQLWRDEQIKCIRHSNNLSEDGMLINVSYEDFISNEVRVIDHIIESFGLEPAGNQVDRFSGEKADVHEWANLNKPTLKNNSGKYMDGLSKSAIRKIEGICWHQMKWLSYLPINKKRPGLSEAQAQLEVLIGKFTRKFRGGAKSKGITPGQLDRIRFTKGIKKKWQ